MKLWDKGKNTDEKVDQFTVGNDRELDLILAIYDVEASKAHAGMLAKTGILTKEESDGILQVLESIEKEIRAGDFVIEDAFEDVHSKLEHILTEKLGNTGKKIHTARSRNDQVLVALQLYLKDELVEVRKRVGKFFDLLLNLASQHEKVLMPGYTHMQIAMPSSFGLWFSAYAETLIDDVYMLNAALKAVDQNPLGSAAGYGSSFPIDREFTTKALGFHTQKYNVIAAQMGRGKVEKLSVIALAAVGATLSKMAMDICLYMGQNFDFISFPEEITTGSSIMPHKKNPDVFELIRGKCNKLQGFPAQLTHIVNNLPSGYHRDLQLTKEITITAIEEIKSCLDMATESLAKIQVRSSILENPLYDHLFSVERLNELVQQGQSFRDAYQQVAREIEEGNYKANKDLRHVHSGSLGNLCLDGIREKMEQAFK